MEYQAYFTGLYGFRLYSYGGFYAKGVEYNPTRTEILVGPSNFLSDSAIKSMEELNAYAKPFGYTFVRVKKVYPRYELSQLANHRAIVVYPYAAMSYSITDFYIAKIPIFVPSAKIWKGVTDRSIRSTSYCGPVDDIEPVSNVSSHKFSPNDESNEPYEYWLWFADYFQWPFVTVFESNGDLVDKLRRLDLKAISKKMKAFNYVKEADLLDNWCRVLKKKDAKSKIPASYQEALDYFNVKTFT